MKKQKIKIKASKKIKKIKATKVTKKTNRVKKEKALKPMPARQLKAFKTELLKLQEDLARTIENKKKKELDMRMAPEPGDDADIANDTYEKEMLFEISDNEREILTRIEDALRKVNDKTYGYCDRCKKKIPKKRLKIVPYSRYCLNCQTMVERM